MMARKWTVMVYLAGDNNLSDECVWAISEMKRVPLANEVTVIAQLDTGIHENPKLIIREGSAPGEIRREMSRLRKAAHKKAKAAELARNKTAKMRTRAGGAKKVLKEAPAPVSYADVIYKFIEECIGTPEKPGPYRADHYMLVLGGHSGGILGDFLSKEEARGISSLSVISL